MYSGGRKNNTCVVLLDFLEEKGGYDCAYCLVKIGPVEKAALVEFSDTKI